MLYYEGQAHMLMNMTMGTLLRNKAGIFRSMRPATESHVALTERFRAARGLLEKLSDALLTTAALFSLFNSRRDYGQALLCYYLVHTCLEKFLEQCKTNPSKAVLSLATKCL